MKVAGATIVVGGGPEDPAGDLVAGGEIVVGGVIAGAIYLDENKDAIAEEINSWGNALGDYFNTVFSKGGKQNKYDDQLSTLSNEALQQLEKSARASNQTELLKKIKTEWKNRGQANKQKRQSRGY